jgi:hypothetical protein
MTALRGALPLALALCLFGSLAAAAQDHPLSVTLSGGVGGSLDEDESGFSNATYQMRFAVETARHTNLGIRLGRMDFGDAEIGRVSDVTLDFVSVAGEYIFDEPSYESGLFLGLGFFDFASTRLDGRSGDETAVGLVVGALAEFALAKRWFVYGEASFAYTNLDIAQLFADLQVGVGFRF